MGSNTASSGPRKEAAKLFEQFLERYHEGHTNIDELCKVHPEHTQAFERWWGHLLRTMEVSESPTGSGSSSLATDIPSEGSLFGSYQIEREIGRGSQGTVFLATDTRLSRRVALKILPGYRAGGRASSKRFAREAELASRLDHKGLCTVYERGITGSTAFLAMRYVEGKTLSSLLGRERRLTEVDGSTTNGRERAVRLGQDDESLAEKDAIHQVLVLFEKIAAALHAAHETRLIHRDVKASNIVVDPQGEPVLLDFGLARDTEGDVLTLTGDLVGTPAYMSPEQLAADRIELDHRTDIYSLGVTLYECLTLHRPFEAPTQSKLYQQILASEPPRPSKFNREIGRDLETVILTALDKDRERRYQTAKDFAEDLRRARCFEPIRAKPAGLLIRLRRWTQRSPAVAAVTILFFVALTTALVVSLMLLAETRRSRAVLEKVEDRLALEKAERAARGLGAYRHDSAAITAWLRLHGQPLVDRLPTHRAELEALRERALPQTNTARQQDRDAHADNDQLNTLEASLESFQRGFESLGHEWARRSVQWQIDQTENEIAAVKARLASSRTWRFERAEDRIAHKALAKLVRSLEEFASTGTYARLKADLEWTKMATARRSEDKVLWDNTRNQIRTSDRYAGVELSPQTGLVPLGPDPVTRLHEFALLRSGEVPNRDKDTEHLVIDARSAVVFVLLPRGHVTMGAPPVVQEAPGFERFSKRIELGWFFIAKHEMSRGQWKRLGGTSGISVILAGNGCGGDEHPVEAVSWTETAKCLTRHGLDLPTVAQWAYAARTHHDYLFCWGNRRPRSVPDRTCNIRDNSYVQLMGDGLVRPAIYEDGFALTAPIWTLRPNGFGLHHIGGNVQEWCREPYVRARLTAFQATGSEGEHLVPAVGLRTVRGGYYETRRLNTYLPKRYGRPPEMRHRAIGFRAMRRVE